MTEPFWSSSDLLWWIGAVDIPALGGLCWLGSRRFVRTEEDLGELRDNLAAYKLEAARTYVSAPAMQNMEKRLTAHLDRIERRLNAASADGSTGNRL